MVDRVQMSGTKTYEAVRRRISSALRQGESHLDLSNNQLPLLLWQLMKLRDLRPFDSNQLTALPPEIGQLTALRSLRLDGNKLTALPPELWQLTALQDLSLDQNRLTALPPEIGRLTALRSLCLDGNKLTALPPELWQLTALPSLRNS